ncbi:hypothetical protein [Hymenobacter metallicola]|uniref:Uncharacterized protein n=1 Tax=Hymenobacter metallicola TaxID=2563114 RepID=A0A4Z0QDQ1_9BACT|nr:hypothetical protein [Hymenobacter metallicola]TGE28180.1 hypothetical protein E5K02_01570 [Hymenobacter metallicola]
MFPITQRRLRHLERKYERGSLTYSEYVELLTKAYHEPEEFAQQSYVGYRHRYAPPYGLTKLY